MLEKRGFFSRINNQQFKSLFYSLLQEILPPFEGFSIPTLIASDPDAKTIGPDPVEKHFLQM